MLAIELESQMLVSESKNAHMIPDTQLLIFRRACNVNILPK